MGKVMSIALGAIVLVVGAALFIRWFDLFVMELKATTPTILIITGFVAIMAGISELKDSINKSQERKKE